MGLPAIDQQLQKLRAQLADLSSRYTDQHPDVRKLKEEIAKTENLRDQLLASLKNKPPDARERRSYGSASATGYDPGNDAGSDREPVAIEPVGDR